MSDCPASFSDFHRAARLVRRAARAADGRLGLFASRRGLGSLFFSRLSVPFPPYAARLPRSFLRASRHATSHSHLRLCARAPRRLNVAFSEVISFMCGCRACEVRGVVRRRVDEPAERAGAARRRVLVLVLHRDRRVRRRPQAREDGHLVGGRPSLMRVSAAAPTTWWESRDARDAERGRETESPETPAGPKSTTRNGVNLRE